MRTEWSDEELRASVLAYMSMLGCEKAGKPYSKKEHYRALSTRFGRTEKAFEYRMQNISTMLSNTRRDWIPGLKPAANVGANVADRIEGLISDVERENRSDSTATGLAPSEGNPRGTANVPLNQPLRWPFSDGVEPEDLGWTEEDEAEFSRRLKLGEKPVATPLVSKTRLVPPVGVANPQAGQSVVTVFPRDLAVKAWVLARAAGVCECCKEHAPFFTADGEPFLEVHHVRQLAQQGSDRVSNAVALCPNCHRRLHYGNDAACHRNRLYDNVTELEREQ